MRTRISAALLAAALLSWISAPAAPVLAAAPALAAAPVLAAVPARVSGEISADPAIGLSTTQLDSVSATAIEPALRQSGSLTSSEWVAVGAAAVVLLGLLLFAGRMLSRRGGSGRPTAESPPGPTTAELAAAGSAALVATDDAIKTSEQELGFAVARFGDHAAAPFSVALRAARSELAAAFRLRQLLDDDIPETEPVRRSMLGEMSGRCAEANRLLDEQSQAFDQLQNLEARAPEVLAEVDHHVTQQDARVGRSEPVLSRLAVKYSPEAVAAVSSSPGQARERLEFARGRLSAARQSLAVDGAAQAAVSLQAAESAADQAESLLDGIEHLEAELTQAASALPTALREIGSDLAEATALPGGPADGRAAVIARAHAAATAVRDQLGAHRPFDTLAALRHLEEAGAELDHSLASAREARARKERARAVLDQAMLVARSSVTAAEDFITTRRGGVGATARTRLAEAHRHFQQAIAYSRDDPETALAEAQHADVLGQQARSLAEQDVAEFSYAENSPVIRGGGFGGGFGGAILGGILVDSLVGGGRSGGFGLGGLGPGSFGGIGTRGRHSSGGTF